MREPAKETVRIEKNSNTSGLSKEEQLIHQILLQMPYPVEVFEPDGTAIMVNTAFLEMFGIPSLDFIVGKYNIFQDPIIMKNPDLKKQVEQVYAGKTVYVPEITIPLESVDKKNGISGQKIVIHEITMFPVFDSMGKLWRVVTIWKDISKRRQAEKALEEEKERLIVTLKSIGDAVISTDREGRIMLMNMIAEHLTGYREEEAAGR